MSRPVTATHHDDRPLAGIRVLEVGQLIAGPFAGSVLAYFGAEVIKVEPPNGGDAIRSWRAMRGDTSYWWYAIARNKKSVTLDLRRPQGQRLAKQLAMRSDVLLENFRPGTMEKWGLGPEVFEKERPELVYTRVSGFGQTGPYAERPGFASACEAMGGLRYVNGFKGEAPVRANLSLGDTLAALHAVIGTLLALFARVDKHKSGQVVDVAIYESVFNMMESVLPEYDGANLIRQPSGTTITGIVPTNTYRCADGKFIVIGGNADSMFKRLMTAAGRSDMADDPRLAHNPGRVAHQAEIDEAIGEWAVSVNTDEALSVLEQAAVPAAAVYNIEDIATDPHYQARAMFEDVNIPNGTLKIPAITPKLSKTPGKTTWSGPELGAHTESVLMGLLGISRQELTQLKADNIV